MKESPCFGFQQILVKQKVVDTSVFFFLQNLSDKGRLKQSNWDCQGPQQGGN